MLTNLLMIALLIFTIPMDYYKLNNVRRVDKDLYKTLDGLYISTKYCYRYTYGENALLKWNGQHSGDNKIIWSDDSTCEVDTIFKK